MGTIILVTGGARSGKSRIAEGLAAGYGEPLLYLATGQAGDPEMAARIERHRQRRGAAWQTVEEPLDLLTVLEGHDGWFGAVLVDCVTLWVTNLMLAHDDDGEVLTAVRRTAAAVRRLQTPLVLVTNEVGMGIVPDNPLARRFRDLAGEANEILATGADQVYAVFAGLPLRLK
jgi:adenosylcobinamide kinase/adenosylcobinamide-phosphate guanylyltransferase